MRAASTLKGISMSAYQSLVRSSGIATVIALAALTATSAQAAKYDVLHTFAGGSGDGAFSYNNVSFDSAGNMYGTANLGGPANAGAVYKIAPDGTYSVLHFFDGGANGLDPNAGVTIDPATGDLYGTTTFGGNGPCRNACGLIYKISAGGTFQVLHQFDDSDDGRYPAGQLLIDKKGNIFGETTSGGPGIGGSVFEYSAKGKFKTLHFFADSDGFQPQGNLLMDKAGDLYGATYSGGADEYGTVFKLTTKGALTTLYTFTGGNDGGDPNGGLAQDSDGNLYGSTNPGGNGSAPFGTVFRLAPNGTLTTLYTFTGGADGGYPAGNVLLNRGKILGTTPAGGKHDDGVVYEVDASAGGETVIHNFSDKTGASPQSGLVRHNAILYGAAAGGGASEDGVVYSLKK